MHDSVASPSWPRVAVHAVRTAITIAALTLLVGFGALGNVASPGPAAPSHRVDMSAGPLDAMMQQNRCSFTGFDRDVIPSKAIVRTPDGSVELVSFDRGWAVFSGAIAGELVAVCLGPTRAG
ncbi:hypothetical protein [Nocardioides humi]|uniref:Uncharacterized protein n=1 Tax=Nocardioides humi TaxID=449461 RepID=A0ABN2ACS0_9ACTN|nr:hypothetical protein [Nocardioides humi]